VTRNEDDCQVPDVCRRVLEDEVLSTCRDSLEFERRQCKLLVPRRLNSKIFESKVRLGFGRALGVILSLKQGVTFLLVVCAQFF